MTRTQKQAQPVYFEVLGQCSERQDAASFVLSFDFSDVGINVAVQNIHCVTAQ